MASMAGPLGALLVGLTASTTEFEDDVDGGPPRGRCQWVRHRPQLSLKTTSMAVPMGGALSGSGSICH
jgi:hypothetical protein